MSKNVRTGKLGEITLQMIITLSVFIALAVGLSTNLYSNYHKQEVSQKIQTNLLSPGSPSITTLSGIKTFTGTIAAADSVSVVMDENGQYTATLTSTAGEWNADALKAAGLVNVTLSGSNKVASYYSQLKNFQ